MKKTLYSPEKRDLCKKLAEAREKANLKQSDVEKLTGILQSELSKIENGQRKIEFLTVVMLAQLLKISPMKVKDYGFKTPVRRTTNNITGNKVGGSLSGGECKIIRTKKIEIIDSVEYSFKVSLENGILLFGKNIGIAAMGGYFISDTVTNINFEISNDKGEVLMVISTRN
jgi:transcriptional regulator with XRE-family HTH domain